MIPLKREELFVKVNELRDEWKNAVVDYSKTVGGINRIRPFREEWDLVNDPGLLTDVGPKLALAGYRLFKEIFMYHDDEKLNGIGNILETASADRPLCLTFLSNEFFIPWGMLYTPPKGKTLGIKGENWDPEGFWGVRHILEHNTVWQDIDVIIQPKDDKLQVGLNVDINLDQESSSPIVGPAITFFEDKEDIRCIIRKTKGDLGKAFSDAKYADNIIYFCCHGEVTGSLYDPNTGVAKIFLSDRPHCPITISDIKDWIYPREFESNPLIFINTCQGGQLSSLFYRSFAAEFLKRKANCVIGAQIDVPKVFAAQYAKRFFEELFSSPRKRVGEIMRDLTREFFFTYKNPLGLIYSLYRGIDTYLDPSWPESMA